MHTEDGFQRMIWGTLLFTQSVGWRSMLVFIRLTQGQGPHSRRAPIIPLAIATLLRLCTNPSWYPKCSPEIQIQPFIVAGCSKKGGPKRYEEHTWGRRGIIKHMLLLQWLVTPHLSRTPSYPKVFSEGHLFVLGLLGKSSGMFHLCFMCALVLIFRFRI